MYTFVYLDKSKKNEILPALFDILYSNMSVIAPSGMSYDDEKREFLAEVSSAVEKAPRQVILCFVKEELAGFLMYYTRDDLLMIEEVQLSKKHQKTMLFYRLCSFFSDALPNNIEFVESFVHKSNIYSLSMQKKLGMEIIDFRNEKLYHLRGDAKAIRNRFAK